MKYIKNYQVNDFQPTNTGSNMISIQFLPSKQNSIREIFQDLLKFNSIKLQDTPLESSTIIEKNIEIWPRLLNEAILNTQSQRENYQYSSTISNSFSKLIFEKCPELKIIKNLIEKTSLNNTIIYDFEKLIKLEIYGNSIHIHGFPPIRNFSISCLIFLIHSSSLSSYIISISIGQDFSFSNIDGVSSVQSENFHFKPFHEIGLTGKDQICGIADSGVNDLSCFFADDSNDYDTHSIIRSWTTQKLRRKIIQYIPYADSVDDEGGHGTHTCGTLAGNSKTIFTDENGIAPDSKIAFFDIGFSMSQIPILIPRLSSVLFPSAYNAGARVHSNSWAGGISMYSEHSLEIDSYLYEHPDFLVIMAAGNHGNLGPGSIGSPANSKNAICVGSIQIRNNINDKIMNTPLISYTSSIGPTYDGRYKPDILAHGDSVVSAYSSSPEIQYEAQHMRYSLWSKQDLDKLWNSLLTCSVHEKSGTSMSTPLIAGSALLIRQYFMQSEFWSSICLKTYKWCKSFEPSGYLLKALILHGGEYISNNNNNNNNNNYDDDRILNGNDLNFLPNYFQGYGKFGLHHILPLPNGNGLKLPLKLIVFDKVEISEYTLLKFDIKIKYSKSISPLKVTICWFDPPSLIGWLSSLLIHNLDLILIDPNGKIVWGNNVTNGDNLNPNEQIYIFQPNCSYIDLNSTEKYCIYTCLVRSYSLPYNKFNNVNNNNNHYDSNNYNTTQLFAIVFTTSGEVIGPEETTIEKWFKEESLTEDIEIIIEDNSNLARNNSNDNDKNEYNLLNSIQKDHEDSITINFFSTPLAVTFEDNHLVHNVVPIAYFQNDIGCLESVTLQLSPYSTPPIPFSSFPLIGLDAFLLTITIIDPNGLSVEIGGFEWPTQKDGFYLRCWPNVWTTKLNYDNLFWESTRVVSSSKLGKLHSLISLSNLSNYDVLIKSLPQPLYLSNLSFWSVSLSIGFKYGVHPLLHYSGTIILQFSNHSIVKELDQGLILNHKYKNSKVLYTPDHELFKLIQQFQTEQIEQGKQSKQNKLEESEEIKPITPINENGDNNNNNNYDENKNDVPKVPNISHKLPILEYFFISILLLILLLIIRKIYNNCNSIVDYLPIKQTSRDVPTASSYKSFSRMNPLVINESRLNHSEGEFDSKISYQQI